MTALFEEIRVEKVSDKIVDQLTALIKDGRLTPGNKLPSERQLIELLGVGRSSLREALNKLETMGYVEIKKRKGIFVKSINSTMQMDPLRHIIKQHKNALVQLYQIREDIEQTSAFWAAQNRTEQELDELAACLNNLVDKQKNSELSIEVDQAFHCAVARASHNFFRVQVLLSIFELSQEFIKPIIRDLTDAEENLPKVIAQHEAIFQAIKCKDPKAARKSMLDHLKWTNSQLLERY